MREAYTLTGMYSDDRNRFIESFNQYSLLIIDDLGIERNSEFALEQVFNIIDSRYRSRKPLIVTTNLTLDELENPKDLAHRKTIGTAPGHNDHDPLLSVP
jgi:DNA replication protein DnaC